MSPLTRRLNFAAMLKRAAWEAEAQASGRSTVAPLLHDLAKRCAGPQTNVFEAWEAIADAAFGIEHGLDTGEMPLPAPGRVPAQRPAPPQPPKRTEPRRLA